MKAVSNLIAVMIIVAIVVGIALAVAFFAGALIQKVKPSGGGLAVTSVEARERDELHPQIVLVSLTLQNPGSETVMIDSIKVSRWDGACCYSFSNMTPFEPLEPSSSAIVTGTVNLAVDPPDYAKITIYIYYHTTTGAKGVVSVDVKVEPWYV